MLHNYFHMYPQILQESEFNYIKANIDRFFDILANGSSTAFYDIISFLGWYGVPVFVFLSGYGLVKRYEAPEAPKLEPWPFIKKEWVKLFNLMWIAIAFLMLYTAINSIIIHGRIYFKPLLHFATALTSLNDIFAIVWVTNPGVYWYFGLAFELYILYALIVNSKSLKPLILTAIGCYAICMMCYQYPPTATEEFEEYLQLNFTGWTFCFLAGIWFARQQTLSLAAITAIIAAGFILFVPSQSNLLTWQFSRLAAIVIIVVIGLILGKIPYVNTLLLEIGRLSAYLFVVHPIVRYYVKFYTDDTSFTPTISKTIIHVAVTFCIAIIYRYLTRIPKLQLRLKTILK